MENLSRSDSSAAENARSDELIGWIEILRDPNASDEEHQTALAPLFAHSRERLLRMVEFRLHPKVRSRIDPWDVLQESYIDATSRINSFQEFRGSFFKWLRLIVLQRIGWLHRHHLGTKKRDAKQDVSLETNTSLETENLLAEHLADSLTSPSQAVQRSEMIQVVNEVLANMRPIDRDVLILRHFEHLSNAEVAEVLDIAPVTSSVRYSRALMRLTQAVGRVTESIH